MISVELYWIVAGICYFLKTYGIYFGYSAIALMLILSLFDSLKYIRGKNV